MHPVLFELPGLHLRIHLYGVMYALGVLLGLWVIRKESKRVGLSPEKMTDLLFYVLIAGTLGSRLLYILVEDPQTFLRPLEIFKLWKGGLVYYGGVIGAFFMIVYYCRRHRLSFWRVADVYVLGLAIGHAVGRIGCFFAGCCHGRTCDINAWYAVVFPDVPYGVAPPNIPLYPTQLLEFVGDLIIFVILLALRRKKSFDGQVFLLYVVLYGVMRSSIELLRGDAARGYVVPGLVSTSQFISLVAVLAAIGVWIWRSRQNRK